MNPWLFGLIGFSLGWLIEFLIDCFWWQKRRLQDPESSILRPLIEEPERRINELESTIRQLKGQLSIIPGLENSLARKTQQYDELCLEMEQLRATLESSGTDSVPAPDTLSANPDMEDEQHVFVDGDDETFHDPWVEQGQDDAGADETESEDGAREIIGAAATTPQPADDLQKIRGIGPKTAQILRKLDIVTFDQIAHLTSDDISRINGYMRVKGRIEKENWIGQARDLLLNKNS